MPSVEEPLGTLDGRSEALFVHSIESIAPSRSHLEQGFKGDETGRLAQLLVRFLVKP
jgi:hypothetical protein